MAQETVHEAGSCLAREVASTSAGSPEAAAGTDRAALAASIAQIYREHHLFVWRVLRRFGVPESSAWDAVQDVFLIVARKLDTFEGRAAIRTWLFRIAMRVASGLRRDAARSSHHHEALRTARTREHQAARSEDQLLLHRLLDSLDEGKRTVFVLMELEELSAREVGELLGLKVPTVYSRLRLAREELTRLVAADVSPPSNAVVPPTPARNPR